MSRIVRAQIGAIASFIAVLELLTRLGVIDRLTMIPPSEMAGQLWRLLTEGALNAPMAQTFVNVALAFVLSVSVGMASGLAIHALPRLRRLADPLLASYYAVPFFVFYPLLIAIFGLNRWPLVAIGFVFGTAAVVIATLNGLDRVPRVMRKLARVHRLGRIEEAFLIVLPAAVPHLFTGLKLALAYAFIGVIAGEFILSGSGLGHAIAYAYDSFDNETMYALMLFVLVLAIALNAALHLCEQRLLRRRRRA
ncbi:MAG TPA: ABC transporter permease subunit [Stellaceae bacterium]|nr:ABC transporter permease subunit [Stellaceae bacterium]